MKPWPINMRLGATNRKSSLVDVREKHEWNEGHIPGAIHVPRGFLELQIEEAVPDKSKTVVLYCAGGVRSLMAGTTLQQMGYKNPDFDVGWFWPVESQWLFICTAAHHELRRRPSAIAVICSYLK